jgi:hypothetical protein
MWHGDDLQCEHYNSSVPFLIPYACTTNSENIGYKRYENVERY